MNVFFLDTEFSNGNFYLGDIFEIALISERSGNVFHSFIKIPYPLDNYIKFMCNVTDDLLQRDGSSFKKTFDDMINFINADVEGTGGSPTTIIIAAHGGFSFDFPLLVTNCFKNKCNIGAMSDYQFIDTLQILQKEKGSKFYNIDTLSLKGLADKVLGNTTPTLHSAVADATTLKKIYQHNPYKNILSENITNTFTLESIHEHLTRKMPLTIEEVCKLSTSVSSAVRLTLLLYQHVQTKTALKKKTGE